MTMAPPAPLTASTPTSPTVDATPRGARWLVRICGVWAAGCTIFMLLGTLLSPEPVVRAVMGMALGLALLWVGAAGGLMFALRRRVRAATRRFDRWPRSTFVAFATTLALFEEAVTTTMTNLAPLWGVPVERAHITASANYLEVVLLHSVVVFVPMFAVWAWLLGRYRFHPATVFLLFGVTGLLAETLSFGLANPLLAGFWIYVYGLMVYLPAGAFPPGPNRRRPRLAVVVGGIVLPLLAAVPVAVLLMLLNTPHHELPPPG
jgi:hypothetical protein